MLCSLLSLLPDSLPDPSLGKDPAGVTWRPDSGWDFPGNKSLLAVQALSVVSDGVCDYPVCPVVSSGLYQRQRDCGAPVAWQAAGFWAVVLL